jgi:uncharacterized delta-60 repeat protein
LAALVAGAGAAGTESEADVTESLGVHYERTEVANLVARPDGSFLALVGKWPRPQRVETVLADGTHDTAAPATPAPPEAKLFPAADGQSYALGYEGLTRLEPDGSPDPTFGSGGTVKPPRCGARAVYELPSGQIAVVCTEVNGTHVAYGSLSVSILDHDGSEAAGGESGVSLPGSYAPASIVPIVEISPTADGGALVVGTGFMVELEPDGSLKRGFGELGVAATNHSVIGADVLPSGAIEAVGTPPEERGGSEDVALYRFSAAGQPEAAFGPQGGRRFDLSGGGEDQAQVVSWGSEGSVLVAGRTVRGGRCSKEECKETPFVAAFSAAGELEAGFGVGGVAELSSLTAVPAGYTGAGVTAIARRPDGSIVAAGTLSPNETTNFFAGLSAGGALLPGFGQGGIVSAPEKLRASQEVVGLVPLKSGGLLAAGTTDVGIEDRPALIRYGADDRLDRSLGNGAGFVFLHEAEGHYSHGATGFAVAGGKILTGVYEYPHSHLVMARAGNGSPVASFGKGGTVDLPDGIHALQEAFAPGGDPLVLARSRAGGEAGVLLRYLPNGKLDRSFSGDGRLAMRLGKQAVRGRALLAEPGGRILVGGSLGHRFALLSLLPDGKPDPRFGDGGWAVTKLGSATHFLALARIGSHIYLAGTLGDDRGKSNLVLMRFDRDGQLDRGFGRGGMRIVKSESWPHPTQIIATPAGPLVVMSGGGKPLITFGRGGKVSERPVRAQAAGAPPEQVSDVRATVSGRQLVVGWTTYSDADGAQVFHLSRGPLDRP